MIANDAVGRSGLRLMTRGRSYNVRGRHLWLVKRIFGTPVRGGSKEGEVGWTGAEQSLVGSENKKCVRTADFELAYCVWPTRSITASTKTTRFTSGSDDPARGGHCLSSRPTSKLAMQSGSAFKRENQRHNINMHSSTHVWKTRI